MAASEFDHQRLVHALAQADFSSARARVSFMDLVMDYMAHVRSNGGNAEEDEDIPGVELESAQRFLQLVNNDVAWPLARQMVPEFQEVG